MISGPGPIDVTSFEAANARAYLRAVFAAWERGDCVMARPLGARQGDVPGLAIRTHESFAPDPGWFEGRLSARPEDDRALVAFSSGTTGQPKAILLQHRALQDVVGRINTAMGVDDSIREYLGVPVTYSFGFGRARAVATAGGRAFLPEHGFDPSEIATMLAAGEINAVSAVPTLWRILLANKDIIAGEAAHRLKWIEIGSQWMTGAEKLELRQLFPNARIVQHYGLTEASRTTLLDISEAPEDRLESVGRAEGDVEIAIDDEGRIRTRGPHLAEGLVTAEGVTPVADADGWLTTSDRGTLDDGWLSYAGRVDELINAGGLKIDPTAFEQAVNAVLGVPGAVAAGRLADPLRGEKVLVALRQDAGLDRAQVTQAVRAEAERKGLAGDGAFEVREVAEIPLTGTGKVKRADLAGLDDLGKAVSTPARTAAPAGPETAKLQALWGEILGMDTVPTDKGFYDLGGDSLSALTAIMRMEKLGIDAEVARGIFRGKTIADLAGEVTPEPPPDSASEPKAGILSLANTANAIHATRGVMVIWVVIVHWLPALLERLGDNTIWIYQALLPVWRLGTPGFALVFGMGVGALGLFHYMSNKDRYLKGLSFNTRLVIGGLLTIVLARFFLMVVEGNLGDPLYQSGLFYSVITYYALALLSLPIWMRLLTRGENRLLTILGVAAAALAIHMVLHALIAHTRPQPVLEFFKLMLTAKYGYFRMTFYVMIGIAIGYLFRRHHASPGIVGQATGLALVLITLGFVGLFQANPESFRLSFNQPMIWHIAIYAGVSVLILAGFAQLNKDSQRRGLLMTWFNRAAIASGILALPIFVGHSVALVVKNLLDALGVPDLIALALVLGPFILALAIAYRKLFRVVG